MDNDNKFKDEPLNFHMETRTKDTHSLTSTEYEQILKEKKDIALKAERDYRKKNIENLLVSNNIDPSKIDIESILDGNIPDWLLDLQKKSRQLNSNNTNTEFVYFQLNSGLVIKLDPNNLTAFRFNSDTKEWNEDSSLLCEYEQGNLRGTVINMLDNYSNGDTYDAVKGRHL